MNRTNTTPPVPAFRSWDSPEDIAELLEAAERATRAAGMTSTADAFRELAERERYRLLDRPWTTEEILAREG